MMKQKSCIGICRCTAFLSYFSANTSGHQHCCDFWLAVKISNLAIRLRDGYTFNHVNPIEAVANIYKPVLFIHSIPDAFIPVTMAKDLYEAKINGARELALFEKGEHAQSFNVSPELYEETVRGFLDKHVRKNWLVLKEL